MDALQRNLGSNHGLGIKIIIWANDEPMTRKSNGRKWDVRIILPKKHAGVETTSKVIIN